jgi:hypothetical protein
MGGFADMAQEVLTGPGKKTGCHSAVRGDPRAEEISRQ